MKKLINLFALVIATISFFSCEKEQPQVEQDHVVRFTTAPITKTVFGQVSGTSVPTLWTANHSVAVSLNYGAAKKSTAPVVDAGGATARFEAEIVDDESGNYKFFAISPYEALVSFNSGYTSAQITFPTAQTPLDESPDEKAQILFGEYDAGSTFPSSVTMQFGHLSAYGKISFVDLALAEGESVNFVSLTASENWAGRYYYYIAAHGDYSAGDYQPNSPSQTITITTSKTEDIWFGCAPVDLGGKTVDVVITTNSGTTYRKTITIPEGKKFEAGKVNAFKISMKNIMPDGAVVYTLVKDPAELTLGSEVILVASNADLAMSTTQNNNNRGVAAIEKDTDADDNPIVLSPGADVQVLTIANGAKGGTYAFYTGTNYLYAESGQNHLRSGNLNAAASWIISFDQNGNATVKSVGTSDTRLIKYNSTNNIFSCYSSGQQNIQIYKKNGTGEGSISPKVPESLSVTGATTSYSVGDTFEFDGTVALVYSDTSTESLTASDYTVDDSDVDMDAAGTYSIVIKYNADNSITTSYTITVSGGDAPTPTTTATFSYSAFSGQGTSGTGSNISATSSVITVGSNKGYGDAAHVRVYSGGKITISSTGGNITKVEITCTASGTANNGPSKLSATGYSYSGNVGTWAGTAAKTVELNATAQVRFTQIVVTYETN